jgi:hypothetical protein
MTIKQGIKLQRKQFNRTASNKIWATMQEQKTWSQSRVGQILGFIDHASLYNLVNKANFVHNLFLVYLSICTCFGQLCAHHQEKQPCLCDTWYLLFCVADCRVCRCQVSHKHSCFSWWWAHSRPKHVVIDKYTKNKLCIKLAIFTKTKNRVNLYQSIIPPHSYPVAKYVPWTYPV